MSNTLGMTMHNPSHYREEAQKFVEQAQTAKSSEHRLLLLRKAQTMVRLAQQAKMMQHIVDDQIAPEPARHIPVS